MREREIKGVRERDRLSERQSKIKFLQREKKRQTGSDRVSQRETEAECV